MLHQTRGRQSIPMSILQKKRSFKRRGIQRVNNKQVSILQGTHIAEVGLHDGNFSKFISKNERGLGKKFQSGKRHGLNDSRRPSSFMGGESQGSVIGKIESVVQAKFRGNSLRTGPRKMDRKVHLSTDKDGSKVLRTIGSVKKPHQKMAKETKFSSSNTHIEETLPKKKKRVIRLDPHDISNKRLADDAAIGGGHPVKPDVREDSGAELSKNAQFRAIQPSLSVLSFVEDNLLGRRRDVELRRAGYNTELPSCLDNIPLSSGSERERIEVPVFRNKLEFFAAAKTSFSFPSPDLPEIAFAGRSNVGKSSLLNALTRQWGVVRTSDKPGLTQTINFFKLGPKLCLVDLPGYGFAYADDKVKEAWQELVKEYVATRSSLKRVCLLVDTKWGMKTRDSELINLMEESQTKYQIVLTKTDLVSPIDVARRAMEIEENLKATKCALQPLMMVSSKTGAGIRTLRTVLSNVARLVKR